MKINKIIILLSIVLIAMLAVSAVSAEDATITDDADLATAEEVQVDNAEIHDDIDYESEDIIVTDTGDSADNAPKTNVLGANPVSEGQTYSFSTLAQNISLAGDVLDLEDNYKYSSSDSSYKNGIIINKDIVINGHGYTIDGGKSARIFNIASGHTVVINDVIFTNALVDNTALINPPASEGGAILNNGTLILNRCTFINNVAGDSRTASNAHAYGGAIYNRGTLTIDECKFNGNSALSGTVGSGSQGGAIFNAGKMTITKSDFTENKVNRPNTLNFAGDGGAIYNIADATINADFTQNSATKLGGAIFNNGKLTINGGKFTSNSLDSATLTSSEGGAIFNDGSLTVIGAEFVGNSAQNGGAISNQEAAKISDSTFTDNTATIADAINNEELLELSRNVVSGPRVAIFNGGTITSELTATVLNGEEYATNQNPFNLTAVLQDDNGNKIQMSGFTFLVGSIQVTASAFDPVTGIYSASYNFRQPGIYHISAEFGNTVIVKNATVYYQLGLSALQAIIDAAEDGAVIDVMYDYRYIESIDADLRETGVVVNKAIILSGAGETISGSGVSRIFSVAQGAVLTLEKLNLINGVAESGGAIFSNGDLFITDCVFENNKANGEEGQGGAICAYSKLNIIGSEFRDNEAVDGGAIFFQDGSLDILSSVFSHNLAVYGGAISIFDADAIIDSTQFIENGKIVSTTWGGAIYMENAAVEIDAVEFDGNQAQKGGAIYAEGDELSVKDSEFADNKCGVVSEHNIYKSSNTEVGIQDTTFIVEPTLEVEGTYTYGEEINIQGTFDWGVNDMPLELGYHIDTVPMTAEVNNAIFNVNIDTQPDVGSYIVIVMSFTDENGNNYIVNPLIDNFEVVKATPKVNVVGDEDLMIGDPALVYVNVTDSMGMPAEGYVIVTVGAEEHIVKLNETGEGEVLFLDLLPEEYAIEAKYLGGDNYNEAEYDGDAVVSYYFKYACFDIVIENIHYGEGLLVVVENVTDINGNPLSGQVAGNIVNAKGDGAGLVVMIENGAGTKVINGLNASDYNVTAFFSGDDEEGNSYFADSQNFTITVYPAIAILIASADDYPVNETGKLEIEVADERGNPLSGYVTVLVDEEIYKDDLEIVDGELTVDLTGFAAGIHSIRVYFDAPNYMETDDVDRFTVTQLTPVMTIAVNNISYGDVAVINFTLQDEAGNPIDGTINVLVKDDEYNVTTEGGLGTLSIENLNADTYPVVANFAGAGTTPVTANALFNVAKNATQIIYEDMETIAIDYYNDGRVGEYFKWRLVDANGNPIANTPMQIGFNGVVYDEKDGIVTDADGYAQLQINLARKDLYTFAVCWLGDENHNGSFVVAKINVDTQTPTVTVPNKSYKATAKTKTLTATFKSNRGTVIANKKITFTVNGKTYSAKTNDKGVASVNVSLTTKGSYAVTAKFAGDNTYSAVTKKATLKLT